MPDDAEPETRSEEPVMINMFGNALLFNIEYAILCSGGRLKPRLKSVIGSVKMHEDLPNVFTVGFLVDTRNRVNYDIGSGRTTYRPYLPAWCKAR